VHLRRDPVLCILSQSMGYASAKRAVSVDVLAQMALDNDIVLRSQIRRLDPAFTFELDHRSGQEQATSLAAFLKSPIFAAHFRRMWRNDPDNEMRQRHVSHVQLAAFVHMLWEGSVNFPPSPPRESTSLTPIQPYKVRHHPRGTAADQHLRTESRSEFRWPITRVKVVAARWASHGVNRTRYGPHGLLPPALRIAHFLDERPLGYMPDNCFVFSDAYKFIFVKQQKNAGSSIIQILKEAICNVQTTGTWGGAACSNVTLLNHGQRAGDIVSRADCVKDIHQISSTFHDYFVFSFLRHPAERAASMVQYCAINWRNRTGCKQCESRGCGVCPPNHCGPQFPRLFSRSGRAYVDYIGHVETLGEDMKEILSIISARHVVRTGGSPIKFTNPHNRSDITDIRVNSNRTLAYANREDKRPPPLQCSAAKCLALRNASTAGMYHADMLFFSRARKPNGYAARRSYWGRP